MDQMASVGRVSIILSKVAAEWIRTFQTRLPSTYPCWAYLQVRTTSLTSLTAGGGGLGTLTTSLTGSGSTFLTRILTGGGGGGLALRTTAQQRKWNSEVVEALQ